MFTLPLATAHAAPQHILCLGAHSDDIELGCGGTILRLANANPSLAVTWVVLSARGERAAEAQASAAAFLQAAGTANVLLQEFEDGYFPYTGAAIKAFFERLKGEVEADLILTHCRHDLHQDHRLVNELTWNTFRNHLILEYEIPKYDGDLHSPNFFVGLDRAICNQKIKYLMQHFTSQTDRYWFTPETFQSLLRLRGVESRALSGYAEGFYCRKLVI